MNKDEFGRYGMKHIVGAGSTTTDVYFKTIVFNDETVISASVAEPENADGDTNINATWPAGSVVYGMFKNITTTSGDMSCYYAGPK